MRRWVLGLALVGALTVAGCGGGDATDFVPGPGKVRASPLPASGGRNVTYPANVTVDGTGLFVFVYSDRVEQHDGHLEVDLVAQPDPTAPTPGKAVRTWLARGESMRVAGLTVTVLDLWDGPNEADVQVTRSRSAG